MDPVTGKLLVHRDSGSFNDGDSVGGDSAASVPARGRGRDADADPKKKKKRSPTPKGFFGGLTRASSPFRSRGSTDKERADAAQAEATAADGGGAEAAAEAPKERPRDRSPRDRSPRLSGLLGGRKAATKA